MFDIIWSIVSRISAKFLNVFPFTFLFLLFVGAFPDIMEDPELNFSFAEAKFYIMLSFSIVSRWILSGVSTLLNEYRNIRTNVRI